MNGSRIDSQGFRVGRWCFPAFSLGPGESIALRLPREATVDHERIIASLTGAKPVVGLAIRGTAVFARPASCVGWRRWFWRSTPFAWMKKHTTFSDAAILSFLDKHRMTRNTPVTHYAATPRMVLGLAAALARKPEVIVFSTAGLDPLGVCAIIQMISERPSGCAAIYLAWPYFSGDCEHADLFPGFVNIAVRDANF